jgi:hypothetical protein
MKKTICKIAVLLMTLVLSACVFVGCGEEQGKAKAEVLEASENKVVIKINEAEENATLISAMDYLKSEGKLQFEKSGDGMIMSINGVQNPADWSSCWMLYTSDSQMANMQWGTTEHNGQTYGSAILGAESLPVATGEIYIFVFESFS